MITYLVGDATDPKEVSGPKLIVHICNDKGGWGAGFVIAVSKKWKQPEKQYRLWHKKKDLDSNPFKLGNVQFVKVDHDTFVVNMIAQEGIGPDEFDNPPNQIRSS